MKKKVFAMDYEEMKSHVGHRLELTDVWDFHSNSEIELEIRCLDCEGSEPILSVSKN